MTLTLLNGSDRRYIETNDDENRGGLGQHRCITYITQNTGSQMTAQRKTIVVAIKGLGIGGAEKLIAESARYWDRDRFEYRVVYALPWKDQLVDSLRDQGIDVQCFGTKRGTTPVAAYRFARLIRSSDASLVHAHLPSMGALTRVVSNVPVVYTEHNVASSYRKPVQLVNKYTYRRNAKVVAVSDAVAESIAKYPSQDTRVIANGVSVDPNIDSGAVRSELELTETEHLVVHVGNIRPHKGHHTLVRAAHRLKSMRSDVQIVSIGAEKNAGDLADVQRYAKELGADDTIRFLGRRQDALRFTAAADIYVNPADVEGLPISVLEALACGRPVVATAVGGVPSIIHDGVTGLLVPPSDPDALAYGIDSLLNDPTKAASLAKAGRELVTDEYGLEAMVRATESLYDEVLDA